MRQYEQAFYEELNLFGFNKFWNYPRTEEPNVPIRI